MSGFRVLGYALLVVCALDLALVVAVLVADTISRRRRAAFAPDFRGPRLVR